MTPAPNRRWLRFSLRTLFIMVTVVACWLGWNVHQVGERGRLLDALRSSNDGPTTVVDETPRNCNGFRASTTYLTMSAKNNVTLPVTWTLLGAKKAPPPTLTKTGVTIGELKRIKVLLPEMELKLYILVDATSWEVLTDDDCRHAFEARRLFPDADVWFFYARGADASRNWAARLDDLKPHLPESAHAAPLP
jgi:hypothetical protein